MPGIYEKTKRPTQEELDKFAEAHRNFLNGNYDAEQAIFRGYDFSGLDFSSKNFSGADFSRCDMRGTNLAGADFSKTEFRSIDFTGANWTGAIITQAEITSCVLDEELRGAQLLPIKEDVFQILDAAPNEVAGVLQKLRKGEIDGSVYEGECACLVGTIVKLRATSFRLLEGIVPDSQRPAESWFFAINKGDTPDTHIACKVTEEWIEEWQEQQATRLLVNPIT